MIEIVLHFKPNNSEKGIYTRNQKLDLVMMYETSSASNGKKVKVVNLIFKDNVSLCPLGTKSKMV